MLVGWAQQNKTMPQCPSCYALVENFHGHTCPSERTESAPPDAAACSLSDFYDLGAVARYHDQPPFETPARTWLSARSITGKTTVEELLRWADQHAIANLERLEITLTCKANDLAQTRRAGD
jgi:hypothetical protein